MLNVYTDLSAIFGLASFLVMMVPLLKPPPKFPTDVGTYDSEAPEEFRKLNKDLYGSWRFQKNMTVFGLALLILSVLLGLAGSAVS